MTDIESPGSAPQLILPNPIQHGQGFGNALAISENGDVVAVGGQGGSITPGRVRVLRSSGGSLVPSLDLTGTSGSLFGSDVALSRDGSTLIVSAPSWQGAGLHAGAVFTYDWTGSDWVQGAPIFTDSIPLGVPPIGSNVGLSGDGRTLAFQARSHWSDTVQSGVVYVMQRAGAGWNSPIRLTDIANYTGSGFGAAIAFNHDGTILAVGSPNDARLAYDQGAVIIFRKLQSGWIHDGAILPAAYTPGSYFGLNISMNSTGTKLLVGSPSYAGLGRFELLAAPSISGALWTSSFAYVPPQGPPPIATGRAVSMSSNGARWVIGEPGSDVYGVDAGRVLVFETPCLEPNIYCTGQVNTLGCVAEVEASGTPSVSSPGGMVLSARNVRNQQNGMLIYSTSGRAQFAWQGGTLCVAPPLRRTALVNSGGTAGASNDCSGVLSRDFNTWAFTAGDPTLIVGQQVRAQFYSRDPGSVANVNLSNAIEFTLEP